MSNPKWPVYPLGDNDSIFALGVASINYAELESVFIFILATALDITSDLATMISAKAGSGPCVQLVEQVLPPVDFIGAPTRDVSEIRYFLKAFEVCTENRNHLMHSVLMPLSTRDETLLYKTSKQGKTIISLQSLPKLRQVADDMRAYTIYGRAVGNAINARIGGAAPTLPFPWPDRPTPPHRMDYTSETILLG